MKGLLMQIYIFASEQHELCAFVGDSAGSQLPSQFAPWRQAGVVAPGQAPPHNLSRFRIESAIKMHGYQLWRLKRPSD